MGTLYTNHHEIFGSNPSDSFLSEYFLKEIRVRIPALPRAYGELNQEPSQISQISLFFSKENSSDPLYYITEKCLVKKKLNFLNSQQNGEH